MPKKIYVAKSGIHGNGVFAKQNLKKGEVAFIMKGKRYHKVNCGEKDTFANPDWVGIEKNTWIDPGGTPLQNINHSCNPNMGIKGKVTFIMLRSAKKGEELTFDYSTTEEDTLWEMKNGEKKVPGFRPIIKSIQNLPLTTYKKYLPYIPKYFQKVYNKRNNLKLNGHKR